MSLGEWIGYAVGLGGLLFAWRSERRTIKAEKSAAAQGRRIKEVEDRRHAPRLDVFTESFNNLTFLDPENWGYEYIVSVFDSVVLYPGRRDISALPNVAEIADQEIYLPIVNIGEAICPLGVETQADDPSLRIIEVNDRPNIYLLAYRYNPAQQGEQATFTLTMLMHSGVLYRQQFRYRHGIFGLEATTAEPFYKGDCVTHL